MTETIAALKFAASNGIVFVEDADRPLDFAAHETDTSTADQCSLTIQVIHAIDGNVSIEVKEGSDCPMGMKTVFDGSLDLRYGRLRVRDVPGDNLVTIGLSPGPNRIKVYSSSPDAPDALIVIIPPL
ncbi:hypothetical protein Ssi02_71770 [Sinosporangium siamense]|uniref:Uncharacterized protein n=1 Tax=Sinosporangium siamense TaxID=1367973 RepID=A0A919VAX0_9ACTN|nr:hypothetical protein Ssi02_71770 [Sinosporangium siamense]